MSKSLLVLVSVAVFSAVACNGYKTFDIQHTLPGNTVTPIPKPSSDCTDADKAVFAIMKPDSSGIFVNSQAVVLNDNVSCAVQVLMSPTATSAQITKLVGDYAAQTKTSAFMILNKSVIPLWYTTNISLAPGEFPSDDDCKFAVNLVNETFPKAKSVVITNPNILRTPTRCYVQSTFANETDFQAYLEFTYPTASGQTDPFHVYHIGDDKVERAIDVYATVQQTTSVVPTN